MLNILAVRLKEMREVRGLSLRQLAIKAHVAVDPLTDFESGKRIPKLEQISKIKKALGVSCCYLVGKTDNHTEIIDISAEFEGFHIHGYQELTEDEINEIRLMASDTHHYSHWYEAMTNQDPIFIED
ncbi:helix-turn-helix domain-containing protein [Lederbergia galactosidilytica]|uniref:helix-turn-helix domain-containing protein n=1 Tax=Lederbergia galactosidilytica TaxID=217031 RepID=UPI0007DB2C89|nr:helix-turn-helix transcriptional regulator [Lederbergia galactosidilytica]